MRPASEAPKDGTVILGNFGFPFLMPQKIGALQCLRLTPIEGKQTTGILNPNA